MKKLIILLLLIIVFIYGCRQEVPIGSDKPIDVDKPMDVDKPIDVERDKYTCNIDSDCVVVKGDYCSTWATSISKDYVDEWNKQFVLPKGEKRFCEIGISLEWFEAKCVSNKCIAQTKSSEITKI